jgi:hypothetical protein
MRFGWQYHHTILNFSCVAHEGTLRPDHLLKQVSERRSKASSRCLGKNLSNRLVPV